MSETKITDLVPQETIDKVKELNTEIHSLLDTYVNTAKEMAKGVDVNVRVVGDIDKLEKLLVEKTKEAIVATEKLNAVMNEQSQVLANTSNTMSRHLMEQERVNKAQRESYTEHDKVKKLLEQFHDTYENQLQSLVKVNNALEQNKKAQKDNEKALSSGRVSMAQYTARQAELISQHRFLTQEKRNLNSIMTAEEKASQSVETSYAHMSQQLELLRKAHKSLSEDGRKSDFGKELEAIIQDINAHLIDLAADMGEFQRNVGNYAIAGKNGVVATDSLIEAMNKEARTMQDLVDQTKILEEARYMLDKNDEKYQDTLGSLNARIEDNKRKLSDVSDILNKDATSVAEAEAQNKRLQEALKRVDLTSDDAQQRIKELNDKIAANTKLIKDNTPAIQDQTKATEQQAKANENLAGNLLDMVGLNVQFGSSLKGLENANTGNMLDGLNTKVKAFSQTLLGLVSNPWVLAILGITGVVAGFKWWYDYNKGLIEATKRTKDFSGLSGNELKAIRNEIQATADTYGKDFGETLEAANAMAKQFGISFQESIHLIQDGFVSGADANGEFLENIKEYPAYFKEAGISASEFIAITTQANQAGIYSDKGVDVIKEGNLRIREMTTATADALKAIGISSKKVQESLADGSKTTFDIMQDVSEKLAEFPESSAEVGTALADIFGGPGEDAGLQYILTLKDIDTNLDNVKDRAGELGKLQEEQLRSQVELENAIASVFDATGGTFESMTTKAKIFINEALVSIIRKCVDVANRFVDMYNNSERFRGQVEAVGLTFKALWSVTRNTCVALAEMFSGIGDIIKGVLTIDPELIGKGTDTILKGYKDAALNIADDFVDAFEKAKENVENKRLNRIDIKLNAGTETTNPGSSPTSTKDASYTPPESDKDKTDKRKAAKEELKRLQALEESKIAVMADGHDKELAMIRLKFQKKMDEITGQSETEKALRIQLADQCEKEIADCELKYQTELSKINLDNRLAAAEKGSKEELDLKLAQLEAARAAELKAAEKTGADITLINAKFDKERQDMMEAQATASVQKIQKRYADEQSERDNAMMAELNQLQKYYTKELALAGNNESKRAELKELYESKSAEIAEKYAIQTAQASVKMLDNVLDNENLSVEEREKLERELVAAKVDLEKAVTDAVIKENERQVKSDSDATTKRIANAQQWLQVASDSLNAINDLVSTVYDAKIEKIEAEQEANTEAGEAEQERIASLVEKKVITEEEGEARKRAAEALTAKKNEELEKKKQQLRIKQAKWDKANSLAQAAISTALAIMVASQTKPFLPLGLAMAAVAGAMGAAQMATIAATPIPAYAKGTEYHRGGPALVGDGGRQEVVMFNGSAWLTPDTPTLVDIPQGAVVFPCVDEYLLTINAPDSLLASGSVQPVIVNNNYQELKRAITEVARLIRLQTKTQRMIASEAEFERYKNSKI